MSKRVFLANIADIEPGKLRTVSVENISVVIAKTADGYCAVKNQCAHMPLPLSGGKLEGNSIVCPWHNSKFNLCSGANEDWVTGAFGVKMPAWSRNVIAMGRQPQPITAYPVTEEDGKLYIEL